MSMTAETWEHRLPGMDVSNKGRLRKRARKDNTMTYRETMEKFVNEARDLIELRRFDVLHVFLANYGPKLIDYGIALDRLYDENERLTAIVNMMDIVKERDDLKARVSELEKK